MFTAYDITCQVRDEGARVLHDEVRRVVHDLYETNKMEIAYERTLTEIGGARGPAYVYHHYTADPTTYRSVGNLPGAQSYIIVNLDAPLFAPPPADGTDGFSSFQPPAY
jgi:hypothetical protein